MSRSNPHKAKPRAAKTTLLVFGEGLAEEVFLKHLQGLYARDSGVSIKVRKGHGGSAPDIVIDASRCPGDFDRKVVVLDNDKDAAEMALARAEANKRGIELIENSPCLEALLLLILDNRCTLAGKSSSWCKREFETKYLDKRRRTDPNEVARLFPKGLLDGCRRQVPGADALIKLMGGKS